MTKIFHFILFIFLSIAAPIHAATSSEVTTQTVTARLITVQNGIVPGQNTLSAGLHLSMVPGWKTYWRSPGEVGLPPELDWSGSENVAHVALSYPAPQRFVAFDIQNFGYADEVVFPLQISLKEPDRPVVLDITAHILVCEDICIPETVSLRLDLPRAMGQDTDVAALLSRWIAQVPDEDGRASGITVTEAGLANGQLVIAATSQVPFRAPDVFPELGAYAAFGAPDIELSADGLRLRAAFPILTPGDGQLDVTIVDQARATTQRVALDQPPARIESGQSLWMILGFALLGGLILNVMPCVLPVLAIKLTTALGAVGHSQTRIRTGFLVSALGILVFFWALAVALISLKSAGAMVGWGIQFQSPVFLSLVIAVLVLFSANLLGAFDLTLPQSVNTRLAQTEATKGWLGEFATGAFAALLATPCSAPFLGTAVAYALSRGPVEIFTVFTALGFGLALPYLLIAARPGWIARLPKPGRWMLWVQWTMAGFLVATTVWLLSILSSVAGATVAVVIAALSVIAVGVLFLRRTSALWVTAAFGLGALSVGLLMPSDPGVAPESQWSVFDRDDIAQRVLAGEVIFVDVTADWCITCQANKALVLDRGRVADALETVTRVRADWTRPNPDIQAYLQEHGRFGIPFNIVYGPNAPDGVVLPEILTPEVVLEALQTAGA